MLLANNFPSTNVDFHSNKNRITQQNTGQVSRDCRLAGLIARITRASYGTYNPETVPSVNSGRRRTAPIARPRVAGRYADSRMTSSGDASMFAGRRRRARRARRCGSTRLRAIRGSNESLSERRRLADAYPDNGGSTETGDIRAAAKPEARVKAVCWRMWRYRHSFEPIGSVFARWSLSTRIKAEW